ncbi:MAG: 16S rRNA methyltransferase [Chloroflexi bacterium]|nr:16S rRNA methyltransferase [Chloroflexota bacterium]
MEPTQLDQLIAAVHGSAKYRQVSLDLVRRIGATELARRRSLKDAVKETKNKLHQSAAAYLDSAPPYAAWLAELRQAQRAGGGAAVKEVCAQIMARHASTRERLLILDEFYATILAGLPPVRSVLDVACGLNPLAIPWMPLAPGASYYACDVYHDLVGFLNSFFEILGVQGQAEVRDLTQVIPAQEVDLALALKTLPCLEQIDRSAGERLLQGLRARRMLVSFPIHSLGGRPKGMAQNYAARFGELAAGRGWAIQRFDFATELAFLVTKAAG